MKFLLLMGGGPHYNIVIKDVSFFRVFVFVKVISP